MDRPNQHPASLDAAGTQPGVARRTVLGATLAGTAAAIASTPAAHAAGSSPGRQRTSTKFAVIADSHVEAADPGTTRDLVRTLKHIDSRDPDFVLHCGDITEFGSQADTDLFKSAVPSGLRSKMHYVPGNHETQWDADAWEAYRRNFGKTHFSFDAGGVHVIGMDPLESQEWPSYQFGQRLLDDVRADLEAVPKDVPIVMFNHFPLADNWTYVNNVEDFLRVIEPFPVRLMFTGHAHRLEVRKFNGMTHLIGEALRSAPVYLWAERTIDEHGDRFTIHEVRVPASGPVQERLATNAPLGETGPGGKFGPLKINAKGGREKISVQAVSIAEGGAGPAEWPSMVKARIYPQGMKPKAWIPLERSGKGPRWHGTIDASSLPPGSHRVQLQASDAGEDPVWNALAPVSVPTTDAEVAWSHPLTAGTVMAGLAQHEKTVVAGTTDGVVEALAVDSGGAESEWRRQLGGVFKAPVVVSDGEIVLVGSADHHLYALELTSGRTVWRRDLGAPVTCELAILDLPEGRRIGVAVGTTFFLLDLEGKQVWTADLGGTFTGSACYAGGRIYVGSGDGNVYALDAKNGRRVWSSQVATKTDSPYHRIIYGPWGAPLQMLSTGDVFVPLHTSAVTLSADTGEVQWSIGGLHRAQFTRPVISEHGVLIFDGKEGDAFLLDQSTGETKWHDQPFPFVGGSSASWGSSPVPTSDPAVYWMVATTGMLAKIDLSQPSISTVLKVSNTFTTSTPALLDGGEHLVTIDHPGVVRGISGLDAV